LTRINTIPVHLLTDAHLTAEYREITRPYAKIWQRRADNNPPLIPEKYTMGAGHETFFFNKGVYLSKRVQELYQESINRGFKFTHKEYLPHPEGFNDDWQPTTADHMTNISRILDRLTEHSRYYGKKISKVEYLELIRKSI
jgi:deoxyribonuclease (pyrimidine dimer)